MVLGKTYCSWLVWWGSLWWGGLQEMPHIVCSRERQAWSDGKLQSPLPWRGKNKEKPKGSRPTEWGLRSKGQKAQGGATERSSEVPEP